MARIPASFTLLFIGFVVLVAIPSPSSARVALVMLGCADGATMGSATGLESFPASSRSSRMAEMRDAATRMQDVFLADLPKGLRLVRRYWLVNVVALEGDDGVLASLAGRADVRHVEFSAPVHLVESLPPHDGSIPSSPAQGRGPASPDAVPARRAAVDGETAPSASVEEGYAWPLRKMGVPALREGLGLTGKGVRVAVIDTGADATHPDLAGKIVAFGDFVAGRSEAYDDNGHGSHCAGSVAGGCASGRSIGVAPGASLIVAKALSAAGSGETTGLLAAMEWVVDPDGDPATADGAVVVSNSWGSRVQRLVYREAIAAWRALGILPIFAAGNDGPRDRCIASPASFPEVFAVGAIDERDGIASFSSRGPSAWDGRVWTKPDGSAPGVAIESCKPGGGWIRHSGTSMACPHVAGAAALLLEGAPDLSPEALRALLRDGARDLGPSGPDSTFGHGAVALGASAAFLSDGALLGGRVRSTLGAPVLPRIVVDGREFFGDGRSGAWATGLAAGEHEVTVEAFGHEPWTGRIELAPGERRELATVLEAHPRGAVEFALVDGASGAPVAGRLRVVGAPLPVVEAPEGMARVELPLGTWSFELVARGWATERFDVDLAGDLHLRRDLVPVSPVLLVDGDGGADYEGAYVRALDDLHVAHELVLPRAGGFAAADLAPYATVVWFTGRMRGESRSAGVSGPSRGETLSSGDRLALEAFLKDGGKLLLSGQNLAASLRFDPFLRHVLAARHARDSVDAARIRGLGGQWTLGGAEAVDPDSLDRLNGMTGGREVLLYAPIGGCAAVLGEIFRGPSLLCGFGLEGVNGRKDRAKLLGKLLDELDGAAAAAARRD